MASFFGSSEGVCERPGEVASWRFKPAVERENEKAQKRDKVSDPFKRDVREVIILI